MSPTASTPGGSSRPARDPLHLTTSLRAKLFAAFGLVLFLLLVTAGVALWQLNRADIAADEISGNRLPAIRCLGGMETDVNKMRRLMYGHAFAAKDQQPELEAAIGACIVSFETHVKAYLATNLVSEERELTGEVQKLWVTVHTGITNYLTTSRDAGQAEALVLINDTQEAQEESEAVEELLGRIDKLVALSDAEAKSGRAVKDAAARTAYLITAISAAVALVIGISLAIILARNIVTPVVTVRNALDGLADGDLTRRVADAGRDEVGRMAATLNRTMDGLRDTVGSIVNSATGVSEATVGLTAVSRQLTTVAATTSTESQQAATAAGEVAHSIATIATGVEELGASVSEIARSAGAAADVAKEGVAIAADADRAMERLGASSSEIDVIIKLIAGISEQTNLLALNATIEAARAGEAGRGFAVVANEVKELARRSGSATGDIGKRIAAIKTDTQASQEALRRIHDIVGKIHDLQQSIASAVEEQSATANELSRNVSQVAQAGDSIARNANAVAGAAKQAASGADQGLKAAGELSRLADDLRQSVSRFKV